MRELGIPREFTSGQIEEEEQEVEESVVEEMIAVENNLRSLSLNIFGLEKKLANKEVEINQVLDDVEKLEAEISANKMQTLGRMINYFKNKDKEKQKDWQAKKLDDLQEEFEEIQEILQEIRILREMAGKTDAIEESIKKFSGYKEHADNERLKFREKEQEVRSIENISKKYNCLFVHGIKVGGTQATVLKRDVPWQTAFKINTSLNPDVSCSSFSLEKGGGLWSGFGVIMKDGSALGANKNPYSTPPAERTFERGLEEEINDVIENTPNLNEFEVNNSQIGGLYITEEDLTSHQEIRAEEEKYNIPIYILSSGKINEAVFDEENKVYKKGEEVNLEDFLANDFTFAEEQKQEMEEEIFEDCPFILSVSHEDHNHFSQFEKGKALYNAVIKGNGDFRSLECYLGFKIPDTCVDLESGLSFLIKKLYESKDSSCLEWNGFSLMGFAESARIEGNEKIYTRAKKTFDKYLDIDYDEYKDRRLSDKNTFKITREDLKYIIGN